MILRSYRDVEIELKKILLEIDELQKFPSGVLGITQADVINLIKQYAPGNIQQATKFQPEDIDSTNHGGDIIHYLIHRFRGKVYFTDADFSGVVTGISGGGGSGNPFQFIDIAQIPVVTGKWHISNEVTNRNLIFSFGDGTNNFSLGFLAGPAVTSRFILFDGNLGNTGQRFNKIWTQDFSTMPGGIAPSAGQVLTALDNQGNAQWLTLPSSTPTVFSQEARQNTSFTLPTSGTFGDIPGCSIVLPYLGTYFITANCQIAFASADVEVDFRAQQNSSGTFADLPGTIDLQHGGATTSPVFTATQSWLFSPSTTNCVVKLQGSRIGTGGSYTFQNDTKLIAIKVG